MPCCRFGVSSRLSGERDRGPLCDFFDNTLTLGQNHQGIVVKIRAGLSITAYTGTFHGSPAKLCNACARLLLLFALIGVAPLATAGKVDLRVLIDVSGSMKHNDPSNLRRPAVRLLAGLLPPTVSAGIWLFGRDVNVLVPKGPVNPAWKTKAAKAANAIHSRAQFTNIESALQTATADWKDPEAQVRREIIVLTDGIVDVPGGAAKSAASRARILDTELARLQAAGAHVNTIALSDQADAELLKKLAGATGGRYEMVTDAATLERIFLKMFEETTVPDALPMSENRFNVDANVQQLTLVIFTQPDEPAAKLVLPDGSTLGQANASATVRWHHEQHYELVTIDHPAPGGWRIDAHVDPDNRALIVTDLSLKVTQSGGKIVAGQTVDYAIMLSDHDQPIARPELLDQVKVDASLTGGRSASLAMAVVPGKQKGTWRAIPGQALAEGQYDVKVTATAPTFTREYRHSLTVSPASGAITKAANPPGPATLDGMNADATAKPADKPTTELASIAGDVAPHQGARQDSANTPPEKSAPHQGGTKDTANTPPTKPAPQDSVAAASDGSAPAQDTEKPEAGDPPATKAGNSKHAMGWIAETAIVLVFNILLIAGGYFAYRQWKKRAARMKELEKL